MRRKKMIFFGYSCSVNFQYGKATLLLISAAAMYLVALLTNSWFVVAPHSHYGVWSVTFCDFLICQLIPVPGSDAPEWYLAVQILSVLSYLSLVGTVFSLLSPFLVGHQVCKEPSTISFGCVISALFTTSTILVFYFSLLSDSTPKYHPHFSWSSAAAASSCVLEVLAAILLVKNV